MLLVVATLGMVACGSCGMRRKMLQWLQQWREKTKLLMLLSLEKMLWQLLGKYSCCIRRRGRSAIAVVDKEKEVVVERRNVVVVVAEREREVDIDEEVQLLSVATAATAPGGYYYYCCR